MRRRLIKVPFRRRLECKTDYKARSVLLRSKEPRLVIRKTNKYIIAQIIKSKEAQDITICYVNSKELINFGWNLSFKNIPAAYLTGMLIAKKARKKRIEKAIVDIGLYRSTKKSKLYGVVKGAIDGGLVINCKKEILPSEDQIKGNYTKNSEKINEIFNVIKEKIIKE